MAFVAVKVTMVTLSPVVALMRFVIASSASFSFLFSPFSVSNSLFAWYTADFDVRWDSRRSRWAVVKSVLEFSHVFCSDGFLHQSFKSSLKMPVFNTRFYTDGIICYRE